VKLLLCRTPKKISLGPIMPLNFEHRTLNTEGYFTFPPEADKKKILLACGTKGSLAI
jgi:hypothetical protein